MILTGLLFSMVLSEGHQLAVNLDDSCFSLTQRLHSTQFESESSKKRVNELKTKINQLTETEERNESSLVEKSDLLKSLEHEILVLQSDASAAQHSLEQTEQLSVKLKHDQENGIAQIRDNQIDLAKVKAQLEEDMNIREAKEAEYKKLELMGEMLSNDAEATKRTLSDSEKLLESRRDRRSHADKFLSIIANQTADAKKTLDVMRENHTSALNEVSSLKRRLADALDILYSEKHHREELLMQEERAQTRVEGDKVDRAAKVHNMNLFLNGTLSQSEKKLVKLENEIHAKERAMLNMTQEIRFFDAPHNSSESPLGWNDTSVDMKALKDSLRESEKFLSKQGYTARFSLAEDVKSKPLAGFDTKIRLLRESSRMLSLRTTLHELYGERAEAREELSSAIRSLDVSRSELGEVDRAMNEHERQLNSSIIVLKKLDEELVDTNKGVSELRLQLNQYTAAAESSSEALRNAEKIYNEKSKSLTDANATYANLLNSEQQSEVSMQGMRLELATLETKKNDLQRERAQLELQLHKLDESIKHGRATSARLHGKAKMLEETVEDQRRRYTESIAEVAQVARRLREKIATLDETKERSRRLQASAEDLETTVSVSLEERSSLDQALEKELDKDAHLQATLKRLRRQMLSLQCNV